MDNKNQITLKNMVISKTTENNEGNKVTDVYVYFNKDGQMIIMGMIKNDYCWCSITNINEEKINSQIFDYLVENRFIYSVGRKEIYNALKEYNITNEELEYYYGYIYNPDSNDEKKWRSIYGFIKGWDDPYKGYSIGKSFAEDVKRIFLGCEKNCKYRLCEGEYINTLNKYIEMIENTSYTVYDVVITPIEMILNCEKYLRMASDEKGAFAYVNCVKKIKEKSEEATFWKNYNR